MQFLPADIQHIADLARLELTSEELEFYGSQLSAITAYIDQLQAITAVAAPTAPMVQNVWREDEAHPWDEEERNRALSQGELEGVLVKVKRVL